MLKLIKRIALSIMALCVVGSICSCGGNDEAPYLRLKYESYMPKSEYTDLIIHRWGGDTGPYIGSPFNTEEYDSAATVCTDSYIATGRELVSATSENITVRIYVGIEDDVKESLDLGKIGTARIVFKSSVDGTENNEYFFPLTDIEENEDYFVDFENKVGTVTKDSLRAFVDVTVPRSLFPDIYGDGESADDGEYEGWFNARVDLFSAEESMQSYSNTLTWRYSRTGNERTLILPVYSEADEALCIKLEGSHFENAWYSYPAGLEPLHPTATDTSRDVMEYYYVNRLMAVDTGSSDGSTAKNLTDSGAAIISRLVRETSGICSKEAKFGFYFSVLESFATTDAAERAPQHIKITLLCGNASKVVVDEDIDLFAKNTLLDADSLNDLEIFDVYGYLYQSVIPKERFSSVKFFDIPEEILPSCGDVHNLTVTVEFTDAKGFILQRGFLINCMRRDNKVVLSMDITLPHFDVKKEAQK